MNTTNETASLPASLADRPWRKHAPVFDSAPPTMLRSGELHLLHWLTSTYYQGEGAIIDAGCFLGGSTHALASGLAENRAAAASGQRIQTYDVFSTAGPLWYPALEKFGLRPDQSFADRFRGYLNRHLDRVEVHAGDLLQQSWGRDPVEILFLDICKSPALHDHATQMWFPRLIPGRSIVIQQDFGWRHYYWGNIMMEVFRDHFAVLDDVPVASRVYLCTKQITEAEAAEKRFAGLSADDRLRHMEAALQTVTEPSFRGNLLVNLALVADLAGRRDLVEQTLRRVLSKERSDEAAPFAVQRFAKYFTGPEHVQLPQHLTDPRLDLISQTSQMERLCLYSLVAALQPQRVLEIGRARGGSTMVIAAALGGVPDHKFVSLDPNKLPEHKISPKLVAKLSSQVTFIDGFSPTDLPSAAAAAGGKFDFVFIDANHYYEPCLADIEGVIPYLNDDAVLLLHDGHFPGVKEAVRTALSARLGLIDCGLVSTMANRRRAHEKYLNQSSLFGGLLMLRYRAAAQSWVLRLRAAAGVPRRPRNPTARRPQRTLSSRVKKAFKKVLRRAP